MTTGTPSGTAPSGTALFDTALFDTVLAAGDDALIAAQRTAQWCSRAPQLEEDVALANIALDLIGQARELLTLAGELEGRGRDEDVLAFTRSEREFRNAVLVERPHRDFAVAIATLLCFSTYQELFHTRLAAAAEGHLAAVAAKAATETAYHVDHAVQWTLRLGDGTPESHRRMTAAVEEVWPFTHELFEPGAPVDPAQLRTEWLARVTPVLEAATVPVPRDGWRPTGGRRGLHSEEFGRLLAEMQSVHRAHPGASW